MTSLNSILNLIYKGYNHAILTLYSIIRPVNLNIEMEILTNKQIYVFLCSFRSQEWGEKIPKKSKLGKVDFYAIFKMAAKIDIILPITL